MRALKITMISIVAVALSSVIFGVRIAHPQEGLGNALGPARSGVVIFQKSSVIVVGSKVVVHLNKPNSTPALALVSAKSDDTVDVQVGSKLLRIKQTDVMGHLIAVVPFIGSLLSIINL